ncbi:MAG: 4'-phosphopantetheinyl transferase family protein [Hyphomicrobiaceae bacterium]
MRARKRCGALPRCEVWLLDVAASAAALDEMERRDPHLPSDEKERAAAVGGCPSRAAVRRACRIALRLLIERCAGPDPARRPFAYGRTGKPYLPDTAVHFNLSHRQDIALIALSHGERVGIDVEIERGTVPALSGGRGDGLRKAAAAMAPCRPLPVGSAGTLQAWTRLEAAAKGEGGGIGRLLTDLGLRGNCNRESGGDAGQKARAWLAATGLDVVDLVLPEGMFGALALRGARSPLRPLYFPANLGELAALSFGIDGSRRARHKGDGRSVAPPG